MICAIAGIGAIFGIMITPIVGAIALIVLSFYDIVAVYKTRHMIHMAEGMVRSGAIFGFIIPTTFKSFLASRQEAQIGIGNNFMILGSGDIGLPVVFASSLMRQSLNEAIIVAGFALIGLLITHVLFISQKNRQAMAALPPIATLCLIGYAIAVFL
jgi:presenilin-like A22 family membrane protease